MAIKMRSLGKWRPLKLSIIQPQLTLMGRQYHITFVFSTEPVMLTVLILCHISFSTGRTNVLNGTAHLALFAAYMMTIFA